MPSNKIDLCEYDDFYKFLEDAVAIRLFCGDLELVGEVNDKLLESMRKYYRRREEKYRRGFLR